ncbi:hypothetical protein CEP53_013230 [Fusarium sp. AF-6]|nr:hypothetical protein CEP53_013230 [Fusarium sp. AF-6]
MEGGSAKRVPDIDEAGRLGMVEKLLYHHFFLMNDRLMERGSFPIPDLLSQFDTLSADEALRDFPPSSVELDRGEKRLDQAFTTLKPGPRWDN